VVGVGTEGLWKKFVAVLQAEATLGRDARFANNSLRIEHRVELLALLQERFDAQARDAWLDKFAKAGIPAAPINSVPEALRDAQALARGLIVKIEHPALREVRSIANPIKFSDLPVTYRLPPPMLGEHGEEILRSLGANGS
jgi:crotonobetainyl-CoA:carnitine CoA-transferase CaiB-like acyl-CoA transferase